MNIHLYIRITLFLALQLSFLSLNAQSELEWSKNLGGSSNDFSVSICSNGDDGAILMGHSASINTSFGTNNGKFDVFIQEITRDGSTGWAKNLGTAHNELAGQLIYDGNSIYQTSINYNFKEDNNSINLSQYDLDGNTKFSTMLEMKGLAFPKKMFKNASNEIYLVGNNDAKNSRYGGWDVFLYKLNNQGSIAFEQYFGGNQYDGVESIIELADGSLILTGLTYSKNAFNGFTFGKKDAWVMKLDSEGETIWAKRFGSNGYEEINAAALDNNGNVILSGVQGAFDFSNPVADGIYHDQIWVMSIDGQGEINWEKKFGGLDDESVTAMIKDGSGNFVILANTKSVDGIAAANKGNKDALVLNIDDAGSLRWSSTYGGEGNDEANDLFIDQKGGIWVVGQSDSKTGDVGQNNGQTDAWLFKIKGEAPNFTASLGPDIEICLGQNVNINADIPSCDCTYLWSDGSTQALLQLTPQSDVSYQITITDADGNQAFDEINISVSTPPSATLASTDLRCFDEADGSIQVQIDQGTQTLAYNWSNGSIEKDQYGLAAGAYKLTIVNGTGCSMSYEVQLDQPEDLSYNVERGELNCADSEDGSIEFNLVGGVLPYTYEWSNGGATNRIDNLTDGFYQITATDGNECQIEYSTQLNAPEPIQIIEDVFSTECSDEPSGSITLEISGGTSSYNIAWSDGSTGTTLDELMPGVYSVTVMDENGCEISKTFEVDGSESIQLDASVQNVSCNGMNNGSISILSNSVSSTLIYEWSNDADEATIENLSAGSYSVTVSNMEGCEEILEYQIEEPEALELNSDVNELTCFDSEDGSISLEVNGGSGAIIIEWENGTSSLVRTSLEAGTYNVLITDENECTIEEEFIIDPIETLEISAEVLQNECLETTSGEITIMVTGGTGAYEINWSNGADGLTQSDLEAGTYTVSIMDANDCQTEASFEIEQSFQLNLQETIADLNCFESKDGSISVELFGNKQDLNYRWSNGNTGTKISNLDAGLYSLTVSNANGCERLFDFEVEQPETLLINTQITDANCYNEATGELQIDPQGGTAPYEIILLDADHNSIASSNLITGLVAGNYSVQVTDINNCMVEVNLEIDQGAQLLASFTIGEILCPGVLGSIEASPNANEDLFFEWSNGVTGTVNDNLTGGSYFVSITNEAECESVYQILIDEPDPFKLVHAISPEQCYQEENGEIAVAFSGGTAPYVFEWSNGANELVLEGLAPGDYDLNILDANACAFDTSFVVEKAEEIQVQVSIVDPIEGEANGSIALEIEGQTGPYFVTWSNGQEGTLLQNLGPGIYTYMIVDGFECTKTGTFELIALDPLSTISLFKNIKVYPNPASESITFKSIDLNLDIDFVIINGLGQVFDVQILEKSKETLTISVLNLNSGIYFMQGNTSNGRILEKIIVQRID